jgi:GT2 family glycosyltransferase
VDSGFVMTSQPSVVCVVLNWNGWHDTFDCLDSLKQSTYGNLAVVVVDNGSTNDSVERIRAAYPGVLLLESRKNLGFAGGCNVGARHGLAHGAEYIWFLNNDTQAAPDALSALVSKALTDRQIGAVASICYHSDAPALVQAWAGARVNLWIGYIRNCTEPHPDDWFHALYGASLLIARPAIEDIGLLDEGFFVYWEETEFCLRLRKKGWLLAAAPESRVLHRVAASTGRNSLLPDRYFTTSGLRILRLHSAAPGVAMFIFVTVRLVRRLLRLQFSHCRSVWEGVKDYRKSKSRAPNIR